MLNCWWLNSARPQSSLSTQPSSSPGPTTSRALPTWTAASPIRFTWCREQTVIFLSPFYFNAKVQRHHRKLYIKTHSNLFIFKSTFAWFKFSFVLFVIGRTLLFNSSLILLLVHRYTVTKLRELGFGFFLPLDHNIYIHKFIGVLIFFQSWFHTIMHICNFCKLASE